MIAMIVGMHRELNVGDIVRPGVDGCNGLYDWDGTFHTNFTMCVLRRVTRQEFIAERRAAGVMPQATMDEAMLPTARFYEVSVD